MMQIPSDVVQEYEVPSGITAIRIEAQATAASRASNSAVTRAILPCVEHRRPPVLYVDTPLGEPYFEPLHSGFPRF
jgi:hypothetical protein